MKSIHTNKNHLKQLEVIAKIGFWEWKNSAKYFYLSDGIKKIFGFLNPNINILSFCLYLKKTHQPTECKKLFDFINDIKKGLEPDNLTLSIFLPDQTIKHLEIIVQIIIDQGNITYYGTVQEINYRMKYNTVKEKEIQFEKKITEIASRFLEYKNFDTDVIKTLSEIGFLLNSSQIRVLNITNNNFKELYHWKKNGISESRTSILDELPPSEKKFMIELLKEKQVIYINDENDVPVIANSTRNFFKKAKDLSLISAGICLNNQTVGAILVSRNGNFPRWDFSDIHIIKMTSLIIGNALKQHRVQKDLKTSEKRLQFALLAGNLGTWEHNLINDYYYFDERYANIFGYSNSIINKQPGWLQQNIYPDHKILYTNAIENCIEGYKNFYSLELKIKGKDGKYKWVHDWGIITNTDENNTPVKMVGVVQDITERKKIETQLILAKQQAENNEKLKTAFLTNMSHEIRTPMNGITGFAELLYHNQVLECDKQKYFEVIWKNSTRLLDLINNILDISKLETKQIQLYPHEYNLNDILDDVERFLKSNFEFNNNINFFIKKNLDHQAAFIITDESRLKQVLINIIGNAIKFTKEGFIKLSYKINNEGFLEFIIQDSGTGIDNNQANVIFKRFGQTTNAIDLNRGGSGLGLPIVKGILELMGGKIWYKSQKNVGSTFYFTIPYTPTKLKVGNL